MIEIIRRLIVTYIFMSFMAILCGCAENFSVNKNIVRKKVVCEEGEEYILVSGIVDYHCEKIYPDAGKSCSGSSDCQGRCIGDWSVFSKKAVGLVGSCEKNSSEECDGFILENGRYSGKCMES